MPIFKNENNQKKELNQNPITEKTEENSNSETPPAPSCEQGMKQENKNLLLKLKDIKNSSNDGNDKMILENQDNFINSNNNEKNKECQKCILTLKAPIKKLLVIDDKNIAIILCCNPPNFYIFGLEKDLNNRYKLNQKKTLFYTKEIYNDINKFPDNSILFCTNTKIKKIKFFDFISADYVMSFDINLICEKNKDLKNINLDLCLPLANYDFITIGSSQIYLWIKQKNKNKRSESYFAENIEIKSKDKYTICCGKEIAENLILFNIYERKKDKDYVSFIIDYEIGKDEDIDLTEREKSKFKLDNHQNSINQLNKEYVSITLYEGGFVIYNILHRKIEMNIKDNNYYFYMNNFLSIEDYLSYIELKKINSEDKLYVLNQIKLEKINNNQDKDIIPLKEEKIEIDNFTKIKDVIIFTKKEEKNNSRQNTYAIIIIYDKNMMIVDFPY